MAELRTLSRPYAQAVFDVAKNDDAIAQWASSLASLSAVVNVKKVEHLLKSPSFTAANKATTLVELLAEPADSKLGNFLTVLAENKRLLLLPAITAQFLELKNQFEKSVQVEMITAFEITETVKQALVAALVKKLNRNVELTTAVDNSLLGGALIRAGDTVIDGSVKGRLAKLAEAMNS